MTFGNATRVPFWATLTLAPSLFSFGFPLCFLYLLLPLFGLVVGSVLAFPKRGHVWRFPRVMLTDSLSVDQWIFL